MSKFKNGDLVYHTDRLAQRQCGLVLYTYKNRSAVLWFNGLFKGERLREPNKRLRKLEVESA